MPSQSPRKPVPQLTRGPGLAAGLVALLVLAANAGLAGASPAASGERPRGGSARIEHAAGAAVVKGDLSMDEAIDRAQKRYRARVVRAEQIEQGDRVIYVLRLLSDEDGRVFTVRVDARSGAMQ